MEKLKMKGRIVLLTAAMALALSTFAMNVETDRTWYLAGEAMTVSVTDADAGIAYAELCDTHGLAAGIVIGLRGGAGRGVVELPPNLHSGYYVLSVYTRNSTHVSQQLVAVVNALRRSEDDDIEWSPTPDPSRAGEGSIYSSRGSATEELTTLLPRAGGVGGVAGWAGGEAEIGHHIIQARVKNTYDGQTFGASQICPTLSIIGKQIHYFEGKMVNDSIAVFRTYGVQGMQPLVLAATTSTGVSLPIEMISPFATLLPKQLPHLVFHYNRSEVEARSIDMQRRQAAAPSNLPQLGEAISAEATGIVASPSWGRLEGAEVLGTKPDLSYNLDEYRQFLTIREVLLEYVICVTKRKFNGVQQLIVRKEDAPYDTSLPTLVLIDGMPVVDTERLLNYDARRIHYINIYGGQYTFGNGVYNGILSFVTRSGRLTNYPVERNMQYLVYEFPVYN